MGGWDHPNPRDAKSRGRVPDDIRAGLLESDLFVHMNRGLLIMASSVHYDNQKKLVRLEFLKREFHGLADGGHTRLIISEEEKALIEMKKREEDPAYRHIKVEILVGLGLSEITDIVGARNTSNQVKDQSLLELNNKFENLKKALQAQPYADDIAYKEIEYYEDDVRKADQKPIDVRDLLAILYMFDAELFSDEKHPLKAYSAKSACLQHFKDKGDKPGTFFAKIYGLLPEILRLRDEIYMRLPELYSEAARLR
jgi:hypothetical protein